VKRSPFSSSRVPLKRVPLGRGEKELSRGDSRLSRQVPLKAKPRQPKRARDTGPSPKVRAALWGRAGGACESCGIGLAGRPRSVQHRIARGMGGNPDPAVNALPNLALLCGSATGKGCHPLAESRDEGMHARGFWLNTWEKPAEVPVALWTGNVAWLTTSGRYSYTDPREAAA
jgi:hypothetical protein